MIPAGYGRNLKQGEKRFRGKNLLSDRLKFLRLAVIDRVDYESGYCDIIFLDDVGTMTQVKLNSALSTFRGSLKGMPERGSVVLIGWIRQTSTLEEPVILSYLDYDLDSFYEYRLLRGKASNDLTDIKNIKDKIGYDSTRIKRRKLYPGEIQGESTQGSEIYLDENVYLSNNKLNEVELVSADQSIRLSSLQYYRQSAASRIYDGMIVRVPAPNTSDTIEPTVLPNGKIIQVFTDSMKPFHKGGKAYNEYRVEVTEKSDGILPITEINSEVDVTKKDPYISFVLGTNVTPNKEDLLHYGKVLRPQIFGTKDAVDPSISDMECLPEEFESLASALQLKFWNSGTKIDIDKQGHLFTNFAASTGQHPLGAGRSWDANFDGSIKFVVGADSKNATSIDLATKGSINEYLGSDFSNRSKTIVAKKAIYTTILTPDENKVAYALKTNGNVNYDISGDLNLTVSGSYRLTVYGKIQEDILGVKVQNYINDMNNVYGGSYKEIVIKDKQEKIGATRDTTITGISNPIPNTPKTSVDTLKILLGSKTELLTLGDRTTTLTLGNLQSTLSAGNIDEKIVLGDRKILVTTGNIKENIVTGSKTTSIVTGSLKESITTGSKKTAVTTGNIDEKVTTGSKKTNVTTGNINESITTGNKKISIKTGNYTADVNAGNITIKTKAGKIEINAVSQTVKISGLVKATLGSGTKAEISAPQVSLGSIPAQGGVVTGMPFPSHLDFLTGLPLIPSKSVKASI